MPAHTQLLEYMPPYKSQDHTMWLTENEYTLWSKKASPEIVMKASSSYASLDIQPM